MPSAARSTLRWSVRSFAHCWRADTGSMCGCRETPARQGPLAAKRSRLVGRCASAGSRDHGVTSATFEAAFAGLTPDPSVVAMTRRQPEELKPVGSYLAAQVTPERVTAGRALLSRWHDVNLPISRSATGSRPPSWSRSGGSKPTTAHRTGQQGRDPVHGDPRAPWTTGRISIAPNYWPRWICCRLEQPAGPRCADHGPVPWGSLSSCRRASGPMRSMGITMAAGTSGPISPTASHRSPISWLRKAGGRS